MLPYDMGQPNSERTKIGQEWQRGRGVTIPVTVLFPLGDYATKCWAELTDADIESIAGEYSHSIVDYRVTPDEAIMALRALLFSTFIAWREEARAPFDWMNA